MFAFYKITHGPEGPGGLVEALHALSAASFAARGCRSSRIWREANDESHGLLLMEEWEKREDLERHVRNPVFRRLLEVLELSQSPPEVVYVEGGRLRGMEWIGEVLGLLEGGKE